MTTVVSAAPDEIEDLLSLMAAFNALEQIPWTRAEAEGPLRELLARPDLGVAGRIVEGGATRGYFVLTWGFDLEWAGRDAFLTELYLVPEARGRGLGGEALRSIEALAAEHGARALHLMVRPENAAALALYRRAGFTSPPRVFLSKALASATRNLPLRSRDNTR